MADKIGIAVGKNWCHILCLANDGQWAEQPIYKDERCIITLPFARGLLLNRVNFLTMSGHSHWSQVKHKKAATDVKKGQMTSKLMNGIYVALKEGPKPETNSKLRVAIEKAREFGIAQDTIERAINKPEKTAMEEIMYEAYGPVNTATLIIAQTDNRNRTFGEIKHLISNEGKLASPGSVAWLFEEKGIIEINKGDFQEDWLTDLANLGVQDLREEGESLKLLTEPKNLYEAKKFLTNKSIIIQLAEIQFLPKNPNVLSQADQEKIENFADKLLDHPDVVAVYTNTN